MILKKFFGWATIIGILGLVLTGYLAYASFNQLEQSKAIEAAKDYEPEPYMMCTDALTPARHAKTGARYTFPNGCLPDGWNAEN